MDIWYSCGFINLNCGWSSMSCMFQLPCSHLQAMLFFTKMEMLWPVCACGNWDLNVCIHWFLLCHISCNELEKLWSITKIQKFFGGLAHIQFISMELFHGIILRRGGASFRSGSIYVCLDWIVWVEITWYVVWVVIVCCCITDCLLSGGWTCGWGIYSVE